MNISLINYTLANSWYHYHTISGADPEGVPRGAKGGTWGRGQAPKV